MSTAHARKLGRERARRFRARKAGRDYVETRRYCATCNAQLSMYAEPDEKLCAPCYAASATLEQYVLDETRQPDETADLCSRGHDLRVHGRMVDKGDGTKSRRCYQCRLITARERARRNYAAKKAAE